MKNFLKKIFFLFASIVGLSVSVKAQDSNFRVIPEFPKEQDTIQLIYDARKTTLKNAENISANLTGFQNFKWVYDRLTFTKNDSVWTSTYVLPSGMAFINLVFESDTIQDKGGERTYSYILSADGGGQVSGGMLAWGMLRTPHIVKGTPYVVDTASYKTDEILLMWVKYELQHHPENRFKVLYAATSALNHMHTSEASQKLQNELGALQQFQDLKEDDWVAILRVYKEILADSVKSSEIENKIKSLFPSGKYCRDQQRLADFKLIGEAKDDASRLKAAMDFVDKHPYNEADQEFNEANRISYINAYWVISVYTSMQKDLETYTKYISKAAPYESLSNVIYRSISVPFESLGTMSAQEILPYAQVVMDRLNYYKDNFQEEKYATLYYSNAALFAKILVQSKLYDQAFVYASAAQSTLKYERADLNDTYVRALEGLGRKKEVAVALETSYRQNQSSPYMLDLMKALYIAKHKSEKGYETYLTSLQDGDKREELKAKVQKILKDEPFANFTLKDQEGNIVNLKNQKGKIVVLDFWASWCAPCKAAFPGMKLAVEHFKNDPDVVFYFVDTQERKPDMTDYVKKYMQENDYPFTVLMDENSEVSKQSGVSAIPHKMVIGPNGRLRFSEVGYMGSASELKDEIVEMVSVLKSDK